MNVNLINQLRERRTSFKKNPVLDTGKGSLGSKLISSQANLKPKKKTRSKFKKNRTTSSYTKLVIY